MGIGTNGAVVAAPLSHLNQLGSSPQWGNQSLYESLDGKYVLARQQERTKTAFNLLLMQPSDESHWQPCQKVAAADKALLRELLNFEDYIYLFVIWPVNMHGLFVGICVMCLVDSKNTHIPKREATFCHTTPAQNQSNFFLSNPLF